jgi:hypothetical protein
MYTGGFHNSEHFGKKLYVLALRCGLRSAGVVIFIGDGARWIWKLVSYHFPEAIQIVDFYHATERLWSLSWAIYGEGTKACKHVVGQRLKQAGMRWSVYGADAILQLRILWKNGEHSLEEWRMG